MIHLLDTHAVLWALSDDPRLSPKAAALFDDETTNLLVSVASVWEMAIKSSLAKLVLDAPLRDLVERELADQGIPTLEIEARHALRVETLPFHHRDPFDRLLAATALVEGFALVSADPVFDAYGVVRIW